MPMLVVAAGQKRLFFGFWLIMHIAFTIMLLTLHRELFIGLPVHLSTEFGIPNLLTAIALNWPQYQPLVKMGLTLATAGILASWFLILVSIYGSWSTIKGEIVEKKAFQTIFLFLPVTVLFVALISNLLLSANLLSFSESRKWQLQSFHTGDVVKLEVKPVQNIIQGVRINLDQVSDPQGQVTACLVNSLAGDIKVCSSAPLRNIDNQNSLMILLPNDYSIQPGENVILELKFSSPIQGRIDPYLET